VKALDLIFGVASPVLGKISPAALANAESARRRLALWRQYRAFHAQIKAKLFPNGGPVQIQSGPFKGLQYIDEIVWGSITPRWMGSYESELHPVVTQIIQRPYGTVIDVGSAEGFYAVGLAAKMPKCKLFAFDIDYMSRRQVARLSQMNKVEDRVTIGSYCDYADIDRLSVPGDTLLVCDIEGHELGLMDPSKAPSLRDIDLLVEIHDESHNPVNEQTLTQRFSSSHNVQKIPQTDRAQWMRENPQIISAIPEEFRLKALDEGRHAQHPQSWLWMTGR
jgi:hypothetical protein